MNHADGAPATDEEVGRAVKESEQLLTAEQVAARLQLDRSWVYMAARQQVLPSVRCGRWVRFRPQDIEGFIAKGGAVPE